MESQLENAPYFSDEPEDNFSIALRNCLRPMLTALDWYGAERQLAEMLPHLARGYDIYDFLSVMRRLHYKNTVLEEVNLYNLDERVCPCLFIPAKGYAKVILGRSDDKLRVFDGHSNKEETISAKDMIGTLYLIQPDTGLEGPALARSENWVMSLINEYRGLIVQIGVLNMFISTLMLAVPIYIMSVYDKVMGNDSFPMLMSFSIGVFIALGAITIFYGIRARIQAYLGARLDSRIGNGLMEKILYLSPHYTERATVGSQISRLNDFDVVREFFSGQLFSLVLELPFVSIFFIAIVVIGGRLCIIPLTLIAVFLIMYYMLQPKSLRYTQESNFKTTRQRNFLLETLVCAHVLKYLGRGFSRIERFRKIAAEAALANFDNSMLTHAVNILSDVMMNLAGLLVVSWGALLAINGQLSIGALITTMILTWRILAPIKAFFSSMTRLSQVREGIRQINALMSLESEHKAEEFTPPIEIEGSVTYNRVSMRYQADMDPAIVGVSFNVPKGQLAVIIGRNGSGKSTLLKLLPGIYTPQAGSVRIDDRDIRQLYPIELRHAIGYVPQHVDLFYGSIAQNMRLANPLATDGELRDAAKMALVLDEIERLPDGFDTIVSDQSEHRFTESFSQRIALARAYLKKPKILLFDEATNVLDQRSEQAFLNAIKHFRGDSTIIMVSHRPSYLKMADKIILMHEGQLLIEGNASDVLPKLPKEFK